MRNKRHNAGFQRAIQPAFTGKIGTSLPRRALFLGDETAGKIKPGRYVNDSHDKRT
jgi:hypothetical protein